MGAAGSVSTSVIPEAVDKLISESVSRYVAEADPASSSGMSSPTSTVYGSPTVTLYKKGVTLSPSNSIGPIVPFPSKHGHLNLSDKSSGKSTSTELDMSGKGGKTGSSKGVLKSMKSLRSMALRSHSRQSNTYISTKELLQLNRTNASIRIPSYNDITDNVVVEDEVKEGTEGVGELMSHVVITKPVPKGGKPALTLNLNLTNSTAPPSQDNKQQQDNGKPRFRPNLQIKVSEKNILDDQDWIPVDDDDEEEEDVPAGSLRPGTLSKNGTATAQSYALTQSGTIFVDGFTGGIGKAGINKSGSDNGESVPLEERLVILCRLGAGASGTVYKALDLQEMRLVALKMIPMFDRGKRRQMVRELAALFEFLNQKKEATTTKNSTAIIAATINNLIRTNSVDPQIHNKDLYDTEDEEDKRINEVEATTDNTTPVVVPPVEPSPNTIESMRLNAQAGDYIVNFMDAFSNVDDGNVALMMEYMDGGSLQDIVDEGGCDSEETLASIAAQGLIGLSFLHKCNQLHRDLKPGNFLISKKGEVKIADFGILRQMDTEAATITPQLGGDGERVTSPKNPTGIVRASTFVGTATYMSPERIDGRTYSYPSDVWSFGLSILTVALGKLPIDTSGGYWSILNHVRDMQPPNVPEGDTRFSDTFRDFIKCCLCTDPDERKSADELLEHPFLNTASVGYMIEGEEERGRMELVSILGAVYEHIEKLKSDYRREQGNKKETTPTNATPSSHPLSGIASTKTATIMYNVFLSSQRSQQFLIALADQLHLPVPTLEQQIKDFIDKNSSMKSIKERQERRISEVATPKAAHHKSL